MENELATVANLKPVLIGVQENKGGLLAGFTAKYGSSSSGDQDIDWIMLQTQTNTNRSLPQKGTNEILTCKTLFYRGLGTLILCPG